jgi:hypothetical protein
MKKSFAIRGGVLAYGACDNSVDRPAPCCASRSSQASRTSERAGLTRDDIAPDSGEKSLVRVVSFPNFAAATVPLVAPATSGPSSASRNESEARSAATEADQKPEWPDVVPDPF